MPTLREVLEKALAADPDDRAAHAAYADHLAEQGDPRGELIQVQIVLEDEQVTGAHRRRLLKREAELLARHRREWLGDLATDFLGEEGAKSAKRRRGAAAGVGFRRGWLDNLHLTSLSVDQARRLRQLPIARLLRRLVVEYTDYDSPGEYRPGPDVPEGSWNAGLLPLRGAPFPKHLRAFQLGRSAPDEYEVIRQHPGGPADPYNFPLPANGEHVLGLIREMPGLEELHLFAHDVETEGLFALRALKRLRVLQLYHDFPYPLETLAGNSAFSNLTHLLVHPHATPWDGSAIGLEQVRAVVRSRQLRNLTHLQLRLSDMGDKGCEEIVRSGVLGRLKVLDLRHGCVTDEGARALAACPDLRNLELLDVQRNRLTAAGVKALKSAGIWVRAENQQQPDEGGGYNDDYLYDGDVE
jgi:uncharacterized protein (TIGR02996 family)